jgi:hypothetical protein
MRRLGLISLQNHFNAYFYNSFKTANTPAGVEVPPPNR